MHADSLPPKRRILVIDDDLSIRHLLCRILVGEGYDPLAAADGESGLKLMAQHGADLVLLDLKMPGMNGQDVLSAMTADYPNVPVIVMTAFTQSVFTGKFSGASAWMQKPLDFPALLELVNSLAVRGAAPKSDLEKG